ncbi:MAG TPA: PstS family phosphate ABC transporter substrate-binding protein [Fimbriimonadaceae bacterium]|nr:PstS family phosphate ABC transporter substrate-binding protein [Fimbriimonadaceae bacterium]
MNNRSLILAGFVCLALLTGCAKTDRSSAAGINAGGKHQQLTVKGSDTMVQLTQAWAQDFMKAHPEISVTVTGGGSNTGIAALLNQGTDIANASRPMKKEEKATAAKNNVEPKEFAVAQDALSIIVNPSNPISELTIDQLADIYLGKITNWKQLGGADMNIVANGRDSSSGTYVFFQEHVLKKQPFAVTVLNNPATTAIVENVSQDSGAIGYVGLGYVSDKVKAIMIKKDSSSPAVHGTPETVLGGEYPLSRPLFQYTAGEPAGAAKEWINWIRGADGQAVVKKLGFVPIK